MLPLAAAVAHKVWIKVVLGRRERLLCLSDQLCQPLYFFGGQHQFQHLGHLLCFFYLYDSGTAPRLPLDIGRKSKKAPPAYYGQCWVII